MIRHYCHFACRYRRQLDTFCHAFLFRFDADIIAISFTIAATPPCLPFDAAAICRRRHAAAATIYCCWLDAIAAAFTPLPPFF